MSADHHRTGCACLICLQRTPAELAARAGGEQGPDAHELEVAALRERICDRYALLRPEFGGVTFCRKAGARAAQDVLDLVAHLARQIEFSTRTFGPGPRAKGVVDHITLELREVLRTPKDLTEWIDVVILAFDGAWREGFSPEQIVAALVAKQAKNEARKWPGWRIAPPGKAIQHDRSGE